MKSQDHSFTNLKNCLCISLFCLTATTALAKNQAREAAANGLLDVTVYHDVNLLARKHQAAENLTELHADFAAYGYRLLNLSPYIENGDLQGFYVSYQKTASGSQP
jgi:hypothetical protein